MCSRGRVAFDIATETLLEFGVDPQTNTKVINVTETTIFTIR